ncbi:MAG TPA: protein translocase subunit SecF, partial [Desulfomonilia bacterium]|nr:protein translocase subunit SecF [Desulfomonilia bacterium]HRR70467.1 protein translocase subunit SecF [Desulfomonilia bacterium]
PSLLDSSISQTLSRTLITSSTTLFVVLALFLFGGSVINNFAFAIMVGLIVGTYSSIFVASPILMLFSRTKK